MKNLKVLALSAIVLGSLGVATSGHAKADSLSGKSTGTLNIKDGALELKSVDSIDFPEVDYNGDGMTSSLTDDTKNTVVTDTTVAQSAWAISGQTDSTAATLTINKIPLTNMATAVFNSTDASKGTGFGTDQTVKINPGDTTIALTADQAKANGAKSVTVDVNWTLAPTTTRASNFN